MLFIGYPNLGKDMCISMHKGEEVTHIVKGMTIGDVVVTFKLDGDKCADLYFVRIELALMTHLFHEFARLALVNGNPRLVNPGIHSVDVCIARFDNEVPVLSVNGFELSVPKKMAGLDIEYVCTQAQAFGGE